LTDERILISIGSNIQPEKHIPAAVSRLAERFGPIRISNVYETHPIGTSGNNFLNLAVEIHSGLPIEELKNEFLRKFETQLGRIRTANKFESRTIDLDIVVYHGNVIDLDLFKYAHLAVPVAELAPDIFDPEQQHTLAELAADFIRKDGIQLKQAYWL
jgi:2-amino-4-hydroxy-6-hydroxymethyldihydropteridine diphosphokinase